MFIAFEDGTATDFTENKSDSLNAQTVEDSSSNDKTLKKSVYRSFYYKCAALRTDFNNRLMQKAINKV